MNPAECIFNAINGKHCVLANQCIVCRKAAEPELAKGDTITLANFGPITGTYVITNIKNGTMSLEFVKQ